MIRKLCVVHWMPVEEFPPAVNLTRYFAERDDWSVSLCTNHNFLGRKEFEHGSVDVVRGDFPKDKSGLSRILAYGSFHLKSFLHLVKMRPDVILYIEPHSAFPVFLSRLFNRQSRIFIHYHEYHAPHEFDKPGMRMARWSHCLEKRRLYSVAEWVSQTNGSRLKLFLEGNPAIDPSRAEILPNYPPRSWWEGPNRAWTEHPDEGAPLRLVYVGALSRSEAFIEEAVKWIKSLDSGVVTLDIFSYNLHEETRDFLREAVDEQIRFHEEGVPYDELPHLLRGFHAGLILYKGNTLNYAHNASNKLFEYLACGLDVLYPKQMLGVEPYACSNIRPRVMECDFNNMEGFSFQLEGRVDLPRSNQRYYCETELERLAQAMTKDRRDRVRAN